MSTIPIFVDEEIIKEYLIKKLNCTFENCTIEQIIEVTKSARYKDFSNNYKFLKLVNSVTSFSPRVDQLKDEPVYYQSKIRN